MARLILTTINDNSCFGLRTLASVLIENGHEVLVTFLNAPTGALSGSKLPDGLRHVVSRFTNDDLDNSLKTFSRVVTEFSPDVVGFSIRSYFDASASYFLRKLRKITSEALLICGGFGPTFSPSFYLESADLVVRGEGEYSLVQIAAALDSKQDLGEICKIPGLAYLKNGKLVQNCLAPPIKKFKGTPVPLVNSHMVYINNDKVISSSRFSETYTTLLGRGCLGHCSYCAGGNWRILYKKENIIIPKRRNRDIHAVISELEVAKEYGYSFIVFADEHLALPTSELIIFFKEYKKKINLPFFCYLHIYQVLKHPEIVKYASDAGMQKTCIGIQTGDEDFCNDIYSRNTKNSDIIKFSEIFKFYGIKEVQYSFIVCHPFETINSFNKSLDLIKQLPVGKNDKILASGFTVLPGSPFIEQYPKYKSYVPSTEEYLWKAYMLQLRSVCDDFFFADIYKSRFFQKYPTLLHDIYSSQHKTYYQQSTCKVYSLIERWKLIENSTIAVWGTGKRCKNSILPMISLHKLIDNVLFFVDNDKTRVGTQFEGKMVFSPEHLIQNRVDFVLIASCFVDDILQTINKLNINIPCLVYKQ